MIVEVQISSTRLIGLDIGLDITMSEIEIEITPINKKSRENIESVYGLLEYTLVGHGLYKLSQKYIGLNPTFL